MTTNSVGNNSVGNNSVGNNSVYTLISEKNTDITLWKELSLTAELTEDQIAMGSIVGDLKLHKFRSMMQNLWRTNEQFRKVIVLPEFKQLAEESLVSILIESRLPPKQNIDTTNYVKQIEK